MTSTKTTSNENNLEIPDKIAEKYFNSLIEDLHKNSILDENDINSIKLKIKTKLLSVEEIITSLETLKAQSKVKKELENNTVKNDFKYNELPTDFFTPIGDKIANEWDTQYSILNTDKWKVPMVKPPVCINNSPCNVYPLESSPYSVNLKHWDESRYVTQQKINKKWAEDQASS